MCITPGTRVVVLIPSSTAFENKDLVSSLCEAASGDRSAEPTSNHNDVEVHLFESLSEMCGEARTGAIFLTGLVLLLRCGLSEVAASFRLIQGRLRYPVPPCPVAAACRRSG